MKVIFTSKSNRFYFSYSVLYAGRLDIPSLLSQHLSAPPNINAGRLSCEITFHTYSLPYCPNLLALGHVTGYLFTFSLIAAIITIFWGRFFIGWSILGKISKNNFWCWSLSGCSCLVQSMVWWWYWYGVYLGRTHAHSLAHSNTYYLTNLYVHSHTHTRTLAHPSLCLVLCE